MRTATTVVGIAVSRDWLDGFCFPGERRFRLANSAEGHELLVAAIREMPGPVKIGFEATGGQEWELWATLVAAGIDAGQLPPAQIKAFALSRGTKPPLSGPRTRDRCQLAEANHSIERPSRQSGEPACPRGQEQGPQGWAETPAPSAERLIRQGPP
jgi:hypothetical protein